MSAPVVEEVIQISKRYKSPLFTGLSFSVPDKGLVFVHGPNGSGKSTLLRILALMEPPGSGEIRLMGRKVGRVRVKDYHIYSQIISYSFQEPKLLPLNVEENLSIPTRISYKRRDELLRRIDLSPLMKKKANKLSGGEKKRVDIARAVIRDTPLLIMDEPLAFLDPEHGSLVKELVLEEAERRAVVVSATEPVREFRRIAVVELNMSDLRR